MTETQTDSPVKGEQASEEQAPMLEATPSKVSIKTVAVGHSLDILGEEMAETIRNASSDDIASITESLSKSTEEAVKGEQTAWSAALKLVDKVTALYVKVAAWDTALRVAFNDLKGSSKPYQDNFGSAMSKAIPVPSERERFKRNVRYHTDYVMREVLGAEVIKAAGLDPMTRNEKLVASNNARRDAAKLNAAADEAEAETADAIKADESVDEGDLTSSVDRVNYWAARVETLAQHSTTVTAPDALVRSLTSAITHCQASIKRLQSIGGGQAQDQQTATG